MSDFYTSCPHSRARRTEATPIGCVKAKVSRKLSWPCARRVPDMTGVPSILAPRPAWTKIRAHGCHRTKRFFICSAYGSSKTQHRSYDLSLTIFTEWHAKRKNACSLLNAHVVLVACMMRLLACASRHIWNRQPVTSSLPLHHQLGLASILPRSLERAAARSESVRTVCTGFSMSLASPN